MLKNAHTGINAAHIVTKRILSRTLTEKSRVFKFIIPLSIYNLIERQQNEKKIAT